MEELPQAVALVARLLSPQWSAEPASIAKETSIGAREARLRVEDPFTLDRRPAFKRDRQPVERKLPFDRFGKLFGQDLR